MSGDKYRHAIVQLDDGTYIAQTGILPSEIAITEYRGLAEVMVDKAASRLAEIFGGKVIYVREVAE